MHGLWNVVPFREMGQIHIHDKLEGMYIVEKVGISLPFFGFRKGMTPNFCG